MNSKLRRRLFLGTLLGGGVVAAGVGVAVWPLSPELRLRRLITSRLHYLKISDEVLDAFVRDFKADPETRLRHFGTMKYVGQRAVYGREIFANHLPFFRFERFVISSFLLSTDFFREGANVNKPVSYVAYNDPYKLGCANQFARL